LVTDVCGFANVLTMISFWGQRSRLRQADDTISHKPMKAISPNSGHRCIWFRSAD